MICPNEHGPDKHGPEVECADCRGFAAVWERLDEFAAPEISPGFDGTALVVTPATCAYRPVKTAVRAGEQTGATV